MMPRPVGCALLSVATFACQATHPTIAFQSVPTQEIEVAFPDLKFNEVRDLVETDAAIWVLDASPPFITRVDQLTSGVLRGGARGQGPGEFRQPVALQVDSTTGAAHVWDVGTRRHTVLDATLAVRGSERIADATWVGRHDIREVTYADPYRVRGTGDEVIVGLFSGGLDRTADFVGGRLVRADAMLGQRAEVAEFSRLMDRDSGSLREFAAVPLWDVCGSELVLWRPRLGDVVWMDRGGVVLASVNIPRSLAPLTESDIAAYLARMARLEIGPNYEEQEIDFAAMARQHRRRFADYAPSITDVRCGERGAVWLQLFDNRSDPLGHGRRWLRVARSGDMDAMEFPAGFRPLAVAATTVFGTYETRDGAERLASWRRACDDN